MADQAVITVEITRKKLLHILIISATALCLIISSMPMFGRSAVQIKPTVQKNLVHSRLFSQNYIKPETDSNRTILNQTFKSIIYVNNTYVYNHTYLDEIQKKFDRNFPASPNRTGSSLPYYDVKKILKREWRESRVHYENFRMQVNAAASSHDYFILTQQNVVLHQRLKLALQERVEKEVSDDIFQRLPEVCPLSRKPFDRCVVMGSSGILSGSKCGKEIDSADFIFRCNIPPISGFEEDAGAKSNLTTMNIMSIVNNRYSMLSTFVDEQLFLKDLSDYHGYLWLPMFGLQSTFSFSLRVLKLLDKLDHNQLMPIAGFPDHFRKVWDFWENRNLHLRPSTGLYLTTTAISLCNHVDLYGFWPLDKDLSGNQVPYHYYDNLKAPKKMHNFDGEFIKLLKLHQKGIVHIHAQPCG